MQFEIKTTPKVKQFRFQFHIPIWNKTFRTIFQFYRTPDVWTSGMTSRCQDGKHVIFLDYDHMGLSEIKDEIKFLQEYRELSHAQFFELDRERSYHVVILDKFPLKKAYEIQSETNIEWAYLNSIRFTRGREWVLRIDAKGKRKMPKYKFTLKSKVDKREISTAHKVFLEKYYGVPKIKYRKEDHLTKMPLVNYNTGNRVD